MVDDQPEDERDIELSSITAIFPELSIDPCNSHSATLELQISPPSPISVYFAAAQDATNAKDSSSHGAVLKPDHVPLVNHTSPEPHFLSHLPPLNLHINLPERYPDHEPPQFSIRTTFDWLPAQVLKQLEEQGEKLWEEYGYSQVVYIFVDFLQQEADRCFGLADAKYWELPHTLKSPLLAYDRRAKKDIFQRGTYECGICLEPKKGSACYQLGRCGHIFCMGCLQDFYNNAITEGDVASVKCLSPNCEMEGLSAEQRRKKKQRSLHPRELLDIPLEEFQIRRYVQLKLKKKLETDKSTVYCPRSWCQGPAKSEKYAKYLTPNLNDYPESDEESEEVFARAMPNTNIATTTPASRDRAPPPDRLSVCSVCAFAFCRLCHRSWHGDFFNCLPRATTELSAEEKASYEYIRLHTSPCPTCQSPCQKTHGCNHMRCFQCNSHFCYLCSSWLSPDNPYWHFNEGGKECYQRLWDLEEGDEGPENRQNGQFVGARAAEVAAAAHLAAAEALQAEEFAAVGAGDEIRRLQAVDVERPAHVGMMRWDNLLDRLAHEMEELRTEEHPQRELAAVNRLLQDLRNAVLDRRRQGHRNEDIDLRLMAEGEALLQRMMEMRIE